MEDYTRYYRMIRTHIPIHEYKAANLNILGAMVPLYAILSPLTHLSDVKNLLKTGSIGQGIN